MAPRSKSARSCSKSSSGMTGVRYRVRYSWHIDCAVLLTLNPQVQTPELSYSPVTSFYRKLERLLLACGGSGFHVGSNLLQVGDGRGIELIERGLVVALGDVIVAEFANQNLFDAFAVVGGDRQFDGRRGESGIGKLAGGELANFVDQRLNARCFHLFAVGRPPIPPALGQKIRFRAIVALDFTGIIVAEIEELLVPEIIQILVEFLAEAA